MQTIRITGASEADVKDKLQKYLRENHIPHATPVAFSFYDGSPCWADYQLAPLDHQPNKNQDFSWVDDCRYCDAPDGNHYHGCVFEDALEKNKEHIL